MQEFVFFIRDDVRETSRKNPSEKGKTLQAIVFPLLHYRYISCKYNQLTEERDWHAH
jgi:hypothetical protein